MINFYLPSFWIKYNLNYSFILLFKSNPEYFYNNIKIGAIYGSFPTCKWNGGRIESSEDPGFSNIENTINSFNEIDIPIRFTWTNIFINEDFLEDKLCNYIMDIANNGMNEIIVNSKILEDYLRNKYPNFKYISSTTKCLLDDKLIKEELNSYYLTVLDYRKNKDFDFIKSLKKEQIEKIELLINPYCSIDCQNRKSHYEILSRRQLGESIEETHCPTFDRSFYDSMKQEAFITEQKLYNVYNKKYGFKHFKIEGRTNKTPDVLESYIYYMIKPEYKDLVRLEMLRKLYN